MISRFNFLLYFTCQACLSKNNYIRRPKFEYYGKGMDRLPGKK